MCVCVCVKEMEEILSSVTWMPLWFICIQTSILFIKFLFLKKDLFNYLKEWKRRNVSQNDIFYPLVCSSNDHKSQEWARLKFRATSLSGSPMWVARVIFYCLSRKVARSWITNEAVEIWTRFLKWGVGAQVMASLFFPYFLRFKLFIHSFIHLKGSVTERKGEAERIFICF